MHGQVAGTAVGVGQFSLRPASPLSGGISFFFSFLLFHFIIDFPPSQWRRNLKNTLVVAFKSIMASVNDTTEVIHKYMVV